METEWTAREIAEKIYALDEAVYRSLDSTLGRVYTQERESCLLAITDHIQRRKIHILRSEMTLILNMIRTVENRSVQAQLLDEFDAVMEQLAQLPPELTPADILDRELADLKDFSQNGNRWILCVGREFGSAGTEIAFRLARRLDLAFYDKEIFELAQKQERPLWDGAQTGGGRKGTILRELSQNHGLPSRDAAFFTLSEQIQDLARSKSCVIVGRCGDAILRQSRIPHISVFIEAPFPLRVKRTMEMKRLPYREASRYVKKMDRQHRDYYHAYTGKRWGGPTNYDLCINSAIFGIEGTVELLCKLLPLPPKVEEKSGE